MRVGELLFFFVFFFFFFFFFFFSFFELTGFEAERNGLSLLSSSSFLGCWPSSSSCSFYLRRSRQVLELCKLLLGLGLLWGGLQ